MRNVILIKTRKYVVNFLIMIVLCMQTFLFCKVFGRHMSFLGPLVPLFWISGDISSGFQNQSGICLFHFFTEVNVVYIPQDPPLVLHMLTSWWPVSQLITSPYASAEVGVRSDSKGQSPRQKMNALPLCQRPGLCMQTFIMT